MLALPVVSSDDLFVYNIQAFHPSIQADPTGLPVKFAFPRKDREPQSGDWKTGAWLPGGPPYTAYFLVIGVDSPDANDPTGVTLAKGTYDVWLRVEGAASTPTHPVDVLKVA